MKFKLILPSYLVLHILLIALGQISSGFSVTFIFSFLIFFYFSCFYIRFFNNNQATWKILGILILMRLLLLGGVDLYMVITDGGYPFLLIHLLAIISGFFYVRLRSPINFVPFILSSVFAVYMVFQGWSYWLHYVNYDTFTGRIKAYKLQQNIRGTNQNGQQITVQDVENKVVLLDFWNTHCGVCFKEFPYLQDFYEKNKEDNSIIVLAVNKPLEEDKKDEAFQVIKEEGYSFPVLLPEDEELPEKFGVKVYPTTFVIDRQGNVVFKGSIENAIALIEELKKR